MWRYSNYPENSYWDRDGMGDWEAWDTHYGPWQRPYLHNTPQMMYRPYNGPIRHSSHFSFEQPRMHYNRVLLNSSRPSPLVPKQSNEIIRHESHMDNCGPVVEARHSANLYTDFSGPSKLEVKYTVTSIDALVEWDPPAGSDEIIGIRYEVEIKGHTHSKKEYDSSKTFVRMKVQPGTWYEVYVRCSASKGILLCNGYCKFKSILTRKEMITLYSLALKFLNNTEDMHPFLMFYRNKPRDYWNNIFLNKNYVMEKYMKDNNGQPGNPINGEIKGLFFSARLQNGEYYATSIYGDTRFLIPAQYLLNSNSRLYFCDFYCNSTVHYVTVVITNRGSVTDRFCEQCLVELNLYDNIFLCIERNSYYPQGRYWINNRIWVEIYYTEDVDTRQGEMWPCLIKGKGTSTPGGLENNKHCVSCNLYPMPEPPPKASMAFSEKAVDKENRLAKRKHEDSDYKANSKRVKKEDSSFRLSDSRRNDSDFTDDYIVVDDADISIDEIDCNTTTYNLVSDILADNQQSIIDVKIASNELTKSGETMEEEFHRWKSNADDIIYILCNMIDKVVSNVQLEAAIDRDVSMALSRLIDDVVLKLSATNVGDLPLIVTDDSSRISVNADISLRSIAIACGFDNNTTNPDCSTGVPILIPIPGTTGLLMDSTGLPGAITDASGNDWESEILGDVDYDYTDVELDIDEETLLSADLDSLVTQSIKKTRKPIQNLDENVEIVICNGSGLEDNTLINETISVKVCSPSSSISTNIVSDESLICAESYSQSNISYKCDFLTTVSEPCTSSKEAGHILAKARHLLDTVGSVNISAQSRKQSDKSPLLNYLSFSRVRRGDDCKPLETSTPLRVASDRHVFNGHHSCSFTTFSDDFADCSSSVVKPPSPLALGLSEVNDDICSIAKDYSEFDKGSKKIEERLKLLRSQLNSGRNGKV